MTYANPVADHFSSFVLGNQVTRAAMYGGSAMIVLMAKPPEKQGSDCANSRIVTALSQSAVGIKAGVRRLENAFACWLSARPQRS